MAYIQEQDEQNQQGQQPQTNQEVQLGTGVQAPTTPVIPQSQAPSQPRGVGQTKGSGRFQNIQNYIQANKQFDTGGRITDAATQRSEAIRQGIESARGQTQQQFGELQNRLGTQGQQLQQQAFQDPTQILQNQEQLAEFQKLRTGGYGQDIAGLASSIGQYDPQLQALQQQAEQAGTESGRFNLLRQRFATPGYSRGQQRLDQLLLQATPGSAASLRGSLENMAQEAMQKRLAFGEEVLGEQGLQKQLGDLASQRQEEIGNLLRYGSSGAVGGEEDLGQMGYEDIQKSLEERINQANIDAVSNLEMYKNQAKQNIIDPVSLGFNPGYNIYDLDLSSYIQNQPNLANVKNIGTEQEAERFRALAQLAGGSVADIFGDTNEFEEYNPYSFDKNRLEQDVQNKQQALSSFEKSLVDTTKRLFGDQGQLLVNHPYSSKLSPQDKEYLSYVFSGQPIPEHKNLQLSEYGKKHLDYIQKEREYSKFLKDYANRGGSSKSDIDKIMTEIMPFLNIGNTPVLSQITPQINQYIDLINSLDRFRTMGAAPTKDVYVPSFDESGNLIENEDNSSNFK